MNVRSTPWRKASDDQFTGPRDGAATPQDCFDWLSFHRVWGTLPDADLGAIAQALQLRPMPADTHVYQLDQRPEGLYLLRWGTVEIYRRSPIGKSHIRYRSAGDLLGYVPLATGDPDAVYRASAIALSAGELWFLPAADYTRLVEEHPAIQQVLSRLLAQDLADFADRTAREQLRIQALQAYLQPIPAETEWIGSSKAAHKLAQQAKDAAQSLQPIVFQAAAGSGKTFLAGWIHGQSAIADHPFAELDCAALSQANLGTHGGDRLTDVLFGRMGDAADGNGDGHLGILALLERGTLLLDNVQYLTPEVGDRLVHYLQTGEVIPNAPVGTVPVPTQSWVRLVLAAPSRFALPGGDALTLKLASLPQRKQDIPAFAAAFLTRFCQSRPPLTLDPADLRRLISYDYPGNLAELAGILKRAVVMTPPEQSVIPEQVLWSVQSAKNAFRIDLLNEVPWLRGFLLSRWWPERLWWLVMALFIPVTLLGFIGPQNRGDSLTLHLFWAWWWPGYLFLFAFVGRVWCAVCPFMITGEWVRRLSLWIWPRELLPWPTRWLNRWGAWVLFGGFLLIYLWEKLWDLPHHADLSSWLLLAITAGAVVGSVIYERRVWCRYLCPISGMNGMFAKLSMVELRSTQQVCGSQCQTFGCYRGSDATLPTVTAALPTEGQATGGCPLYSHPAQLRDNRDCVLCMTCLKACPHRSVQVNLRFPASDLLDDHQGFGAEVALMFLLLGGVLMHHSQRILGFLGGEQIVLDADHLAIALPVVTGLLSLPALIAYGIHRIARRLDADLPPFSTTAYIFLPFTLAANLAHYIPSAITEAGDVLPVLGRSLNSLVNSLVNSLGIPSSDVLAAAFGPAAIHLPSLTWSAEVATFLQGVTLLSALAFSFYPLRRITRRSWRSTLPYSLCLVALTVFLFWLMVYSPMLWY
ncbi:MAG: sigma 54-interacting transcriptional regulator [Synechococcales bacterium]|nr:sigma 54-interacting transcriptional regulator [Synechococcales bacterium]